MCLFISELSPSLHASLLSATSSVSLDLGGLLLDSDPRSFFSSSHPTHPPHPLFLSSTQLINSHCRTRSISLCPQRLPVSDALTLFLSLSRALPVSGTAPREGSSVINASFVPFGPGISFAVCIFVSGRCIARSPPIFPQSHGPKFPRKAAPRAARPRGAHRFLIWSPSSNRVAQTSQKAHPFPISLFPPVPDSEPFPSLSSSSLNSSLSLTNLSLAQFIPPVAPASGPRPTSHNSFLSLSLHASPNPPWPTAYWAHRSSIRPGLALPNRFSSGRCALPTPKNPTSPSERKEPHLCCPLSCSRARLSSHHLPLPISNVVLVWVRLLQPRVCPSVSLAGVCVDPRPFGLPGNVQDDGRHARAKAQSRAFVIFVVMSRRIKSSPLDSMRRRVYTIARLPDCLP